MSVLRITPVNSSSSRSVPHDRSARRPIVAAFKFPFFGSTKTKQPGAVDDLLALVSATDRGLTTTRSRLAEIEKAVDSLEQTGKGSVTTSSQLSATWKLLWTTEKETLFIIKNASLFGTEAGDVFQVIDVGEGTLQNVITFPPKGAFIVDSAIQTAGPQRVNFQFQSATLKLPNRSIKLPPFGKGWFDTVYMDSTIRVAKDIRGDTLICLKDGPPTVFK